MPDPPEFRIGDVARDPGGRPGTRPAGDDPLLALATLRRWVEGSPAEFRERLDRLAERARQESNPDVQAALLVAVRRLPEFHSHYGG